MSTFNGLLEEIPGISVDCFDSDNLKSSVYFLSHCHTDHMKGLGPDFFQHLKYNNKLFFCSHISKSFLEYKFNLSFNYCNKFIIELPNDETRIVNYTRDDNVETTITVCCLSSGHCPGSVMFLFNYKDKKILYTGDFRINKDDFCKLKSLHYNTGSRFVPLEIDKIYLDTTFFNLNFLEFPSRLDSSKVLCATVKNWLERDPKNVVILEISALYGSEFIFIEIYKNLNKKVHVKDHVYQVYNRMDALSEYITNIGKSTPIHACTNKTVSTTINLKCRDDVDDKNILRIILSAQKWANKDTNCIIEIDDVKIQTKNICYSTHCSYNELKSFILYFKPKEIFPCVCHENTKKIIYELLEKIMFKKKNDDEGEACSKPSQIKISNYKIFTKSVVKSNLISDDEDDF